MTYCVVSNVPECYKSANLRKHFKQFVENGAFFCFHYRHRPEERNAPQSPDTVQTYCCLIKIQESKCDEFIETFHHKRWLSTPLKNGEVPNLGLAVLFKTDINASLAKLPELSPPKVMPAGNVGTPSTTFRDMVNKCLLPPTIIKKLGLEFPRTVKRKQYSAVAPQDLYQARPPRTHNTHKKQYPTSSLRLSSALQKETSGAAHNDCNINLPEHTHQMDVSEEKLFQKNKVDLDGTESSTSQQNNASLEDLTEDATSQKVLTKDNKAPKKSPKKEESKAKKSPKTVESEAKKSSYWSEAEKAEEHDGAEDWERHETFNNDVTSQERSKERMFEEDMEIVWDKGSSGLVFYTDANYWADMEGKDTDGLWTDEWDVDMGVYEGQPGDKDAQDSEDMRNSGQFRRFGDVDEKIGDFEKHTKGFGSRLMKKQGWTEGQGLGSSEIGMSEALSSEGGQKPKDKTGFGYRGESILEVIRKNNPKQREPPLIGTKYDNLTDHKESAIRSEDPATMKYRKVINKSKIIRK